MDFSAIDSYAELKMRLQLMGFDEFPSERIFNFAKSSELHWTRFVAALEHRIKHKTPLSKMNLINCGFL